MQIEIEFDRLVDRELNGGCFRPAAERHHGCKASKAKHKHQARNVRQLLTQTRPFHPLKLLPATHTEMGAQLVLLTGDRF
ncbi:Uncharacterised protein [Vibrio cholerae]|uniref:Uncharacterized protein n=1 Tax=Vibrio cholerae TaxID=666 RepID=A0A655VHW0_VIBCL|nr:Uncharacterised protein [Vibrio cholerae]CSB82743.1 Uncharacterised protein [Vibrio cholerae]CSC13890.1 Uncharacterised protein [Vibrio cholerae]CSC82105.1 Uncharacterised protein [Vibrio cholerae]